LEFYSHAIDNEAGAFELIVQDPRLFGASLEKRLKPRLEEAQNVGIVIDAACLRRIAKYTNDKWNASLTFQSK
jgi:hypothetical protein